MEFELECGKPLRVLLGHFVPFGGGSLLGVRGRLPLQRSTSKIRRNELKFSMEISNDAIQSNYFYPTVCRRLGTVLSWCYAGIPLLCG